MKTYDIRTVMDFADIPEDRVDVCLDELKDALRYLRTVKEAIKRGKFDVLESVGFAWTDDGDPGFSKLVFRTETGEAAQ